MFGRCVKALIICLLSHNVFSPLVFTKWKEIMRSTLKWGKEHLMLWGGFIEVLLKISIFETYLGEKDA